MIQVLDYHLSRNPYGKIVLTTVSNSIEKEVVPVRAFPISSPLQGIALVDIQGYELAWIENLAELPQNFRELIENELASREFIPEIKRIVKLSSFITPTTWSVETDRGNTDFVLKGEEDIRRLSASSLMIADQYGIHFLIRDRTTLDRHSRKLLDHFL
ncbi:protein of unknown function [Nitrosomonas sp. PY1]|uniref:cyanophycin metabolism-associated DUF1854 family protein n=1 Tax=Nitrosomonas sp. PY1 TaxID=1803906 RepID=UPI001FC8B275|nr:DUF1854 domain-containing protein [Nitrosomonas sp. PY1]GKS68221.1 protein of unknown function [Nitrosomonas sp. PY1]